jgi:hypothetical protein
MTDHVIATDLITQADIDLAEAVVSAANIVTCDGYYEIDLDKAAETIARNRLEATATANAEPVAWMTTKPDWSSFDYGDPVQCVRTRDSVPEFPGFIIGWYERLDGHRGYVLQHDPHRIVHVYAAQAVISRSLDKPATTEALKEAREALTFFASVADEYDDSEDDSFEVWQDAGPVRNIRQSFRLEHYRRARQALSRLGEGGVNG